MTPDDRARNLRRAVTDNAELLKGFATIGSSRRGAPAQARLKYAWSIVNASILAGKAAQVSSRLAHSIGGRFLQRPSMHGRQ